MTHSDFNHLLSSLKSLTPEQVRQVRQQLDRQSAQPKKRPAPASAKGAKRAVADKAKPQKPMTIAELHQKLLAEGRISRLPDITADFDDPDDQPVVIKGEPLSETIIRERR
jgi:hypothetical protein